MDAMRAMGDDSFSLFEDADVNIGPATQPGPPKARVDPFVHVP